HVMLIPFAWLFGPAYWYGRLVGFLGTLVTAGALGYAVWRSERHRTIAALAGLAFLASNTVYHVGPLFRQHMTMVMFETLAIVLLASAQGYPFADRRWLINGRALRRAVRYTQHHARARGGAAVVRFYLRWRRRAQARGGQCGGVAGRPFAWILVAPGGQ